VLQICDVFSVRQEHKICALLGYYATLSGSSIPTFRDNLSVPSSSPRRRLSS
jgi:hypothetical protein